MPTLELFKTFAAGMSDYIARHNSNYTLIEDFSNLLASMLPGATASALTVPQGLREIFDRPGVVGRDAYGFSEGTLTGPSYNLTVPAGAFWNGTDFLYKTTSTTVSLAGLASDTYYLYLDGSGTPNVNSAAQANTVWQFDWNASTHAVSNKALYAGLAILFDGDDYADMLTSAAKGTTYTRVADRLEAIELLLSAMANYYGEDAASHSGLDFYYLAGKVRDDSAISDTAAGHVTLADDDTNYVEVDPADGTVSANTTSFTSGLIPLFQVVTASGDISTVTDQRTWAVAGTGGGGGGHTQNTDTGTTATAFTIDSDATGSPTGRAGLVIENGDDPNAELKFNRDTDAFEYSVDGGSTWRQLNDPDLDLGVQELTRFVAKEDPDLLVNNLGVGSDADYVDLDLSSYVTAPLGVEAAVLRVLFWDSAPGLGVNVKFKKAGSAFSPASAWTVWESDTDPATVVVPASADLKIQYKITASGAGQANLVVYLQGYLRKVTGVGTQFRSVSATGLTAAASSSSSTNLANAGNRGLVSYLKITETGGLVTGTYDVELYREDTFTTLVYQATGIDPAAAYEDWMPFWLFDDDATGEIHLKLINNDTGAAATFDVQVDLEQFA